VHDRQIEAALTLNLLDLHELPDIDCNRDGAVSYDELDESIAPLYAAVRQRFRVRAQDAAVQTTVERYVFVGPNRIRHSTSRRWSRRHGIDSAWRVPMHRKRTVVLCVLSTAVSLMAGVGAAVRLRAQTPPARPAVSLTQLPSFVTSTLAADFNEDGRPDLIGGGSMLQLAFGAGDGTFGTPRSLGRVARPLAVGDFNGDGHLDVVISGVSILPGRGDGTFGPPRIVDSTIAFPDDILILSRAVVGDFNGDGKLDMAFVDRGLISIYPGRGDFTFDVRVQLVTADGPNAVVAADFNGDGRLDLAASTTTGVVDVFLNHGALTFTTSSMSVDFDMWDIAAADFNKDGKLDLVVTVTHADDFGWSPGVFHVLRGNGDGTFQASVSHATNARGSASVAIGDFNHDGNPDIATGNRSTLNVDTTCTGSIYWDSVTIAPGAGDGTFGEPATFRLGTHNLRDDTYQNLHNGMIAADLNGDGWTDLVTSPGAVLLSRPAVANRQPTVSAGPDQTIESGSFIRIDAVATDADNDWLDFEWRDASGRVLSPHFGDVPGLPYFCVDLDPGTYTVTASDRRGGTATDSMTVYPLRTDDGQLRVDRPDINEVLGTATPYTIRWEDANLTGLTSFRVSASADNGKTWTAIPGCTSLAATATTCLWNAPGPVTNNGRVQVEALNAAATRIAFDVSESFQINGGPSAALPEGWRHNDVGRIGAGGAATFDGSTFTVTGAGVDIWGTADEFQYAYTSFRGDFDVVTRVKTVQHVSQWTKAGLMLREQLTAGARHASLFVTPTTVKGIAFQRRTTTDGSSVSTAGPAITAPVWLRLSRAGAVVSAFYRTSDGGEWTLVGTQTFAALSDDLQVGLAVSSHVDATLATATFDHVQLIPPDAHLPPGWVEEDIGHVGAPGSATVAASTASVTGSGADVWGNADALHWAFRAASGDFSVEALVDSVENVNRWTKAGLMIRASSSPGSQHAFLIATPTSEKGIVFQGREKTDAVSIQMGSSRVSIAPPSWLRLTRQGPIIRAYFRQAKTDPWRNIGFIELPNLPSTVEVGLAVSSHVDGTLATARFSQIAIEPVLTWASARIGPGEGAGFVDGTFFSAMNQGADIWGTSDAFTFVYTRWSGDGALIARLNQLDEADQWTKGGLMFRESLAPGAAHAFVLSSPEKGTAVQYRSAANGPSASAGTYPKNTPGEFGPGFWLQIVRQGNVFTAYLSVDTGSWLQIGRAVVNLPAAAYVGLAVTSHNVAESARGLFDDVTLRRF
jgi:regulation of enolase protein 1 (concanavalin A-like superfamily)